MADPNPDLPCPHMDTVANVDVIHLADSGGTMADIRVWCATCREPFLFPDSIPFGLAIDGVAKSLDSQELRVALRSGAEQTDAP